MTRITGPRSPVGVAGLLEIIEQLVEQFEPLGTAAGDVGGLQEGGQGRIAVPAGPGAHGSAGALKDVKACRDVPGVDEIGRASCRERVEGSGGGVAWEKRRTGELNTHAIEGT